LTNFTNSPPAGISLRPATAADLPAAQQLLSSASLTTSGLADQWGEQYCLAVTDAGQVVGLAGYELYPPYALLRSVAVAPEWRGRGLGAALTADRLEAAGRCGIHSVFALTTTAAAYFPKLGFRRILRDDVPAEVQQSPEMSSICPSSATVLRMDLASGASRAASPCCGGAPEPVDGAAIRTAVRQRYGAVARRVSATGCCSHASSCCGDGTDSITKDLYDALQTEGLPPAALLASLGCGNPTALAELRPGEIVLDLGSGGGIDVLLSARRVGPTGKAYGLDMTPDMLNLARRNAAEAGVDNVEFIRGEIENIPLPDASVDVIISNCVINLSGDKGRVLREAYRVLRPGGRFAVSDIVVRGELPEQVRRDMSLWVGCVAGALEETEFRNLLAAAGFVDIGIEPTRVHSLSELSASAGGGCCGAQEQAASPNEPSCCGASGDGPQILSAFVRATKPAS